MFYNIFLKEFSLTPSQIINILNRPPASKKKTFCTDNLACFSSPPPPPPQKKKKFREGGGVGCFTQAMIS